MPDNTNRPKEWPNGEINVPEPNPFSREAILERTGGVPVCMECLPVKDKPFIFRSGHWLDKCPKCDKVTTWGAMEPGEGAWDFKGKYEKPPV